MGFLTRSLRDEGQDAFGSAHDRAGGLGDRGGSGDAVQADSDVPEGGHDLRGRPSAGLGPIFVEGDVAHVVDPVLDGPVPADDLGELGWCDLVEVEVGEGVDGLGLDLAAARSTPSSHSDGLPGVRERRAPRAQRRCGTPTGQGELRPVVHSKSAVGVGREPGSHHVEFVFDRGARRWSYEQLRTSLGGPDLEEVVGVAAAGLPAAGPLLLALLVGALGYGASITLWVAGARDLGAARAQVVFATAPFLGALLAWLVLREPVGAAGVVALLVAAGGVGLVARSQHSHGHVH